MDYIILKIFCKAKGTMNKMKSQPTKRKKIFANPISGKGLISTIYKQLIQLKRKNPKQFV